MLFMVIQLMGKESITGITTTDAIFDFSQEANKNKSNEPHECQKSILTTQKKELTSGH